jgi:hypothetical protein
MSDNPVEPQMAEIAYETDEPVLYEVTDGVSAKSAAANRKQAGD